jgi:hypothetical protein
MAVESALGQQPGATNTFVLDLCNAMTRLANVASAARTEEIAAAVAFGDPQDISPLSAVGDYWR